LGNFTYPFNWKVEALLVPSPIA